MLPLIFLLCVPYLLHSNDQLSKKNDYGLSVYKKANCMGCHSWHGKGGGGYGGGSSLRETALSLEDIRFVVNCGIMGTGMPYFNRKARDSDNCYGKLENTKDFSETIVSSKKMLNKRQIDAVALFVHDELKGKKVDYDYCVRFFKYEGKVCEKYKK